MKKWWKENWFFVAFVAAILTGWVTYNLVAYGDWHCAFARCVRVENIKP